MFRISFFIVIVLFSSLASASNYIEGQVAYVYDGDTFTLQNGQTIRLWGMDAPEKHQPCFKKAQVDDNQTNDQQKPMAHSSNALACGIMSRNYLRQLIDSKTVKCVKRGHSYGRIVGQCYVASSGLNIDKTMVAQGWAIEWRKYSHGRFAKQTQQAKDNNRGMWQYRFTDPWVWRHHHNNR